MTGRGYEGLPTCQTRNLGKAGHALLAQRSVASKARQAHLKKAWLGKQARQVGHAGQARHGRAGQACVEQHMLASVFLQGNARQCLLGKQGKARQARK
eukprot:gene10961-biopygen18353